MVATKLLISLCVAGLASAAPQLGLAAPRVNQQVIVTDVVTALQPSIAQAVAEALRGLGSSSSGFGSTTSSTGFASGSSSSSGNSFGSSSGNSFGSSSGSSFGASSGSSFSAGATGAAGAVEGAKAEYNYEFKVADEAEQTFISQNEARDGNEVTGTYSYVDANGDLVTVNYQAGPMGYTQTLDKQVGVVDAAQRPVRKQVSSSQQAGSSFSSQSGSSFGSQSGSSFGSQSGSSFGSQSGSSFSSQSGSSQSGSSLGSQSGFSSSTTSSSALSQSALIAQIIAALEPQISVAVNNAVRQ